MLRLLGVGGATLLVAGTGVVSYRAYDNGVLASGAGEPYDAWSQWRDDPSPIGAVATAILAANPHNTQPWIFRVTASAVDVFSDPAREMPTVDPLRREHHIGLGCALENLVLGLTARGAPPVVTLLPRPDDPTHLATVTVVPGPGSTSALHDAIGDRHSHRGPYLDRAVLPEVLDDLAGLADDLPGIAVRWFTSPADRAAVGRLIVAATEAVVADRAQSEEAFALFRNDRDDIDRHRDGLTLDGQGLDRVTLSVAKLLPASSRTAGDEFWSTQTRTVHTATAAAYGVLTATDVDDVGTRLTAGRLLQRIHLSATVRGLGLQHMNQVTERIDRERAQGLPATFAPRLASLLGGSDRRALCAFRLGHPVRPALRSPRRPLSDVIR